MAKRERSRKRHRKKPRPQDQAAPHAGEILSEKVLHYLGVLSQIAESLRPLRYEFMPLADYSRLWLEKEPTAANQVYWTEILQWMHLDATAGLVKQRRWADGVLLSIERENYLSFAANLRGLLESSADLYYSLRSVPLTMKEYEKIKQAVTGNLTEMKMEVEDLEQELIHYVYARKLRSAEAQEHPAFHRALRMSDVYIDAIEGAPEGPIHDLYSELCQVVHPAMPSLLPFVAPDLEDRYALIALLGAPEPHFISAVAQEHGKAIEDMLGRALGSCVVCLKILNRFPIKELHAPIVETFDLSTMPGWRRVESLMAAAR